MPVERRTWTNPILKSYVPLWPCPRCGATALALVPGTLHRRQDMDSAARVREEYDSLTETGVFACILCCGRCEEALSASGRYDVSVCDEPDRYAEFYAHHPASVKPAPPMIAVPQSCPTAVRAEVEAAFALYWVDPGSCLNRLRNAIELVLTDMGVKRHGRKSGGGRSRLSLDSRIQVLKSKRPALSDLCGRMLAVKHLGNAGSHPGQVKREDVFDALDLVEHILAEKYANPQSEMAKMVRQINKRRGPRNAGK